MMALRGQISNWRWVGFVGCFFLRLTCLAGLAEEGASPVRGLPAHQASRSGLFADPTFDQSGVVTAAPEFAATSKAGSNETTLSLYSASPSSTPSNSASLHLTGPETTELTFRDESGHASGSSPSVSIGSDLQPLPSWLDNVGFGYDEGFIIASREDRESELSDIPFSLRINGWGQLRHTYADSKGTDPDANQFQLKRARLVFSGSAFTPEFYYFFQIDGRSSSGDDVRLLDYYLHFDIGSRFWGWDRDHFVFRTGKYKMPFTLARELSGRSFEFTDRAVASTFFDVNRSLAWGIYGNSQKLIGPMEWELAVFNGLVTGGAETGSSGQLDSNFAYSARLSWYPVGDWGSGALADFEHHDTPAIRMGAGFANSTIDKLGSTEFNRVRVVDQGSTLASLLSHLPADINEYTVNLYAVDASMKFRGYSLTYEYYFRLIDQFRGGNIPDLFDHGFWLQIGKFIIPGKMQVLARWSTVVGDSGALGASQQSSRELAGGLVYYFRDQHAKLTNDILHVNGAPIDSAALDLTPGFTGWVYRSQIQFSF